jgi:uncharacterized protein YijF (DUF1287 family)
MKKKHLTHSNLRLFSIFLLIAFCLSFTAESKVSSLSIAKASMERTKHTIIYDPTYFQIAYPMGDIPADRGVCTDVLIRSYRALGIDLQKLVHEDMKKNFHQYPKIWGLKKPDKNIDHRRVPNLQIFFKKFGEDLPITENGNDYQPGDIIAWNIGTTQFISHIGIVSDQKISGKNRYKIVHNIGEGPKCEDVLFSYPIIGHYRYLG